MIRRALAIFARRAESTGSRGERFARRWLRRRGYDIINSNVKLGDDEADLIVRAPDGQTIVVVEVKTRKDAVPAPEDQVGPVKQHRLTRFATRLQKDARFANAPMRFDVIAIVWPDEGEPSVKHYENAFDATF